eukprot:CAMPEP_0175124214 /NCGR_PEP_ID=MMETSP0087-20121206/2660_1 /TAXON_ID=136419 /ORGANISM="Unknown Unknown, Strain D1" /LENGTH=88 /DNA_ID=CAMNT_0016405963 /DNA_START=546 /DNA_END=812 /DNA_ORIENTATION=-
MERSVPWVEGLRALLGEGVAKAEGAKDTEDDERDGEEENGEEVPPRRIPAGLEGDLTCLWCSDRFFLASASASLSASSCVLECRLNRA